MRRRVLLRRFDYNLVRRHDTARSLEGLTVNADDESALCRPDLEALETLLPNPHSIVVIDDFIGLVLSLEDEINIIVFLSNEGLDLKPSQILERPLKTETFANL